MDEHYITGPEILILILAGLLLPWIIAVAIQIKIYINKGVPKLHWLISSLIMLFVTPLLGVVIWSAIPIVTVVWQHIVFRVSSNAITNFLGFVPVAPMLFSALLAAIPITLWHIKRHC